MKFHSTLTTSNFDTRVKDPVRLVDLCKKTNHTFYIDAGKKCRVFSQGEVKGWVENSLKSFTSFLKLHLLLPV